MVKIFFPTFRYRIEDELGAEVIHVYDVKNRGPSTIQEAQVIQRLLFYFDAHYLALLFTQVFILWPSFSENGDHLLYLLDVNYDRRKVTCENIKNINPLYVQVYL